MKQAVTYPRVSTKRQEREGHSTDAQRAFFADYAERHNLHIVKEFAEAHSAKSAGRPQFKAMLEYVKKNPETIILVEKTDRLYRNYRDAADIEDLITEYDVEIHLVKENSILNKKNSSFDKQVHGIKIWQSKGYVDNLKEESDKGTLQHLKSGGYHTYAPNGYINTKVNGRKSLVACPVQSLFVKRAFELYASGAYSINVVREKLYEEGYIYAQSTPIVPADTLQKILKNRVYLGEVIYRNVTYTGVHEPIVSRALFTEAQKVRAGKSKPYRVNQYDFLLRGKVHCERCKTLMSPERKKGKYVYYRCTKLMSQCPQGSITEKTLLDIFVERFINPLQAFHFVKADFIDVVCEMLPSVQQKDDEVIQGLTRKMQQSKNTINKAYDGWLKGLVSDELFAMTKRTAEHEIDLCQVKIEEANTEHHDFISITEQFLELSGMLSVSWDSLTYDEQKQIINLVSSNWVVNGSKVTLELTEPFPELFKFEKIKKWRGGRGKLRTCLLSAKHLCKQLQGVAS